MTPPRTGERTMDGGPMFVVSLLQYRKCVTDDSCKKAVWADEEWVEAKNEVPAHAGLRHTASPPSYTATTGMEGQATQQLDISHRKTLVQGP